MRAVSLFSWRDPAERMRPQRGAIRAPDGDGLAPSPTAPFAEPLDSGRPPPLPDLGSQDPLVLQAGIARLRARDPGFDVHAIAQAAAQAMVTVEHAWTTLDPQPSRAVLSPALWTAHRARMELYTLHGRRNVVDGVQVRDATVVAVEQDAGRDRVTVRVRATSTDYDVDSSGAVVRGDTLARTWAEDWVLERSSEAPTRGDGGLLAGRCPSCGAPITLDAEGLCSFCHAAPTDATRDWVVVGVADVRRQEDLLRAVLGVRTHVRIDPEDVSPEYEVQETPLEFQVSQRDPAATQPATLRLEDSTVDATAVAAAARTAFVAVRTAWQRMDSAPARPVMTEAGVDALAAQIAALQSRGLRRATDDPIVESAVPLAAHGDAEWDRVAVHVVATTVDADVDATGNAVRGDTGPHRFGCDMVLGRRRAGAGDVARCPRCGAPLRASVSGVCDYCREAVAGGGSDWVLDAAPVLAPEQAPAAQSPAPAQAPASDQAAPRPGDALRQRDPSFNEAELLARARECFYAVEQAMTRGDAAAAQPYATDRFAAALRDSLGAQRSRGERRVLAFIDINDARLDSVATDESGDRAAVAVAVSGEDCLVDAAGTVLQGSREQRRWTETWTLSRAGATDGWRVDEVSAPQR